LDKLVAAAAEGDQGERIFLHTPAAFMKQFRVATRRLRIKAVPYQTRHSGASIDRANRYRSQEEVKKRGRWKLDRSVVRNERAGRLASSGRLLDTRQASFCRQAAARLEDLFFDRCSSDSISQP